MSFNCTAYNILIASPSDVNNERVIIREVIHSWNSVNSEKEGIILLPLGWDSDISPEMGNSPQEIINKRLCKKSDLLIAIFWTKIGSPTPNAISGTVEEIENHLDAKKPAMIYFSNHDANPGDIDTSQLDHLREYKEQLRDKGIYKEYENIEQFRQMFLKDLASVLNQHEYFKKAFEDNKRKKGNEKIERNTIQEDLYDQKIGMLSEESKALLLETSQDKAGRIFRLNLTTGLQVQTNGKQLIEDGNPRSRAKWEGALDQLTDMKLIKDTTMKGEVFYITQEGYRLAEKIESQES